MIKIVKLEGDGIKEVMIIIEKIIEVEEIEVGSVEIIIEVKKIIEVYKVGGVIMIVIKIFRIIEVR